MPFALRLLIKTKSYFFKGTELPFRLALFWTSLRVTDIVAPILAFGLLRLRGLHGYEGWRWLFLLEGLFTLSIGIWSWFMMAASPTQTKSWWNKKGWFTEREETIMVNRILRDDPSKGDMHNRQAVDFKLLWKSLCDYDLWPMYAIGLTFLIPAGPPDSYLTLTLRTLGFGTFDSNLLSIPTQVLGAITVGLNLAVDGDWANHRRTDASPDVLFGNLQRTDILRHTCPGLAASVPDRAQDVEG